MEENYIEENAYTVEQNLHVLKLRGVELIVLKKTNHYQERNSAKLSNRGRGRKLLFEESNDDSRYSHLSNHEVEEKQTKWNNEEKIELYRETGNIEIRNEIVVDNRPLVISIAKKYRNMGGISSLDDLIQEGSLGLMEAIDKFNFKYGAKFSTYARWQIRLHILKAIGDTARTIRLPIHRTEGIRKIIREIERYSKENSKEPSAEEIGNYLGISAEKVNEFMIENEIPISMQAPLNDGGSGTIGDFIPDDYYNQKAFSDIENKERAEYAYGALNKREKEVMDYRFGLNGKPQSTLERIGDIIGLTKERVRQIQEKATKKMRIRLENWENMKSHNGDGKE